MAGLNAGGALPSARYHQEAAMSISVRRTALALCVAASMFALAAQPVYADHHITVIDDSFVGPLGLAVGDDGTIYVGDAFVGELATIDRWGNRATLVAAGTEVAGVDARGRGNVAFVQTEYEAGEPGEPAPVIDALLRTVRPNGTTTDIASTEAYEQANNPDGNNMYGFAGVPDECLATLPEFVPQPYGGIIESHPYAVAIADDGWFVADAAGNSVIHVGRNGRMSTVAVLPPVPNTVPNAEVAAEFGLDECFVGETYYGEPVPTDVEIGPDGHLYVTSLPGGPEIPGTGSVWRIDPATGAMEQVASGLISAVDLAIADDGTLYVAELFAGRISKIVGGLPEEHVAINFPSAVEIGPDGVMYAATAPAVVGAPLPGLVVRIN